MAEYTIDKFEYDGNVYKLQDNVSGYAPLASPALTGTPTAPTATSGDSSTKIATTAFVQDAMSGAGAGTVTSVGLSNATNGGLSISGSPITSSGSITVGHSNILTSAQTTSGVYPIKIDKNGHISEYGSAVSIPTKTSDLTNDSGFITSYTDTKVTQTVSTSSTEIPVLLRDNKNATTDSGTADASRFVGTVTVQPSTGNLKATTFNSYTLAGACAKAVDSSISARSSSTNLPTSAAVASFVEGKGYITSYTDEKLALTSASSDTTYYPILGSGTTAATRQYTSNISIINSPNSSGSGSIKLTLGNTSASGGAAGYICFNTGQNQHSINLRPSIGMTDNITVYLPKAQGTLALTSDIPTTVSSFTNDAGYLTSYTETDPVFEASAAAGITSTDISNWNAKVSDDHKWNDVSLTHGLNVGSDNDSYVPIMGTVDGTTANFNVVTKTPQNYAIAKYGTGAYLYSTTPSANDNSTKVATTAWVKSALPTKTSDLTNDSGYITGYTETDPVFTASAAYGISSSDISTWNSKSSVQIIRW